jgi:hypothetical protein
MYPYYCTIGFPLIKERMTGDPRHEGTFVRYLSILCDMGARGQAQREGIIAKQSFQFREGM